MRQGAAPYPSPGLPPRDGHKKFLYNFILIWVRSLFSLQHGEITFAADINIYEWLKNDDGKVETIKLR